MLFLVLFANAQTKKVKEKDLNGVWKLVINIDQEEVADELDEEDNIFAKIIAKSVVGIVDDVLGEIDILFEFKSNNRLYDYRITYILVSICMLQKRSQAYQRLS